MQTSDQIALVSALISGISLIVAGFSWWTARRADERAELSERVKVFVDLRAGWHDIRKELRRQQLEGAELPDPASPGWETHERYWQHAFTEWYVTTRLHPELRRLWEEYFAVAIQRALRTHLPLRYAAWILVDQGRTMFGAFHDEFRAELERLNGGALDGGGFAIPGSAAAPEAGRPGYER